ncbi:MAG: HYExAFE family protein [Phycisphaerae bacterium]|nr:HYExAFE family protein [Phycisphaerae bacterium]
MTAIGSNHYERAFESWLKDNGIQYLLVDQQKRTAFSRSKIKSFDFLFYPPVGEVSPVADSPDSRAYIAEVKGRKFSGKTFTAFGSLPNWVTSDDIKGLENWIEIFGGRYKGLFVFAYELENIDVDTDGREIYEYLGRRYVFAAIRLRDYKQGAARRSEKWQTVHLSAEFYKNCVIDADELICRKVKL